MPYALKVSAVLAVNLHTKKQRRGRQDCRGGAERPWRKLAHCCLHVLAKTQKSARVNSMMGQTRFPLSVKCFELRTANVPDLSMVPSLLPVAGLGLFGGEATRVIHVVFVSPQRTNSVLMHPPVSAFQILSF